ncbi:YihY family inner membrane protein [Yimella sp. RIT 621]|uniref:YihY/virulence factor BrkB family protein n=1 Tax=Yimella sp. RIT 621 TaxID=2510323 RepID=UPI00101CF598|nr:YihY/virulence factor BrkB family protein [Yimella sp. RIT 621]RYG77976.1 YihY family inner membrane protein [Yimella sp. RIT 621]
MTVLHDEVIDRPFDEPPESPAKPDWKVAFSRARSKFSQDGGTDAAAALTYYAMQSLFPGLIAVISLLNIFGNGKETTRKLVESIGRIIGKSPEDLSAVTSFIDNVQATPGGGVALIVGIGGALWSASGYVGAFSRALNRIYAVEEGRSFLKLKGTLLLVTAIEIVLIVLVMLSLVLSGGVAKEVGSAIGLGDTAVMVWDLVKWPFVALVVIGIISMLYRTTPNVRRAKGNRLFSSGAVVGFVVWVLASLALVAYIGFTQGASYQKTYGAFAAAIILLLWLWITNIALLFGAELDAELLRTRQLKSGLPAERLILLPARDTDGIDKKIEKDEKQVADAIELRVNSGGSMDAYTGRDNAETATARDFGLAMGPSQHGKVGNGSAPVDREPATVLTRPTRTRESMPTDPNDAAVYVQNSRDARREEALIAAAQERKVRERKTAQEAKVKKKQAEKEKERRELEKAHKDALPLAKEWEAVDAVRAQFAPRPSAERDRILAERESRRQAFKVEQAEANAARAQEAREKRAFEPTAESKAFVPGEAEGPQGAPPAPSVLEQQVATEREKRRNDWYAARGL